MATFPKLAKRVMPLKTNTVQPNFTMNSSVDTNLARQNNILAYRCITNMVNLTWPEPAAAPRADIGTLSTATAFVTGAVNSSSLEPTFGVPFRLSENSVDIRAFVTVAVQNKASMWVGLSSQTLIDTVTTANGKPVPLRPKGIIKGFKWQRFGTLTRQPFSAYAQQAQVTPNLPANRRVLIVPKVAISNDSSAALDLSGEVHVYLKQIIVMEIGPLGANA